MQQKITNAATMTPSAMPGIRPAAKDLPLNVASEEPSVVDDTGGGL